MTTPSRKTATQHADETQGRQGKQHSVQSSCQSHEPMTLARILRDEAPHPPSTPYGTLDAGARAGGAHSAPFYPSGLPKRSQKTTFPKPGSPIFFQAMYALMGQQIREMEHAFSGSGETETQRGISRRGRSEDANTISSHPMPESSLASPTISQNEAGICGSAQVSKTCDAGSTPAPHAKEAAPWR